MRRGRGTQREADIVRKLVPLSPFFSDPTEGNRAAYLQQVRHEREKYALQSQLAAVQGPRRFLLEGEMPPSEVHGPIQECVHN